MSVRTITDEFPTAKVIEDSISPAGDRLTTLEVTLHRFVLAELNTHRAFSRNSASSRAIPYSKNVERIQRQPALPLEWATKQRGMQGGEELPGPDQMYADRVWLEALNNAVTSANELDRIGVHKSIVNRLLEPFSWHTVIVSSTKRGWDNYWSQRVSKLAQPEIRIASEGMLKAYEESTPTPVDYGEWHTPYIDDFAREQAAARNEGDPEGYKQDLMHISCARCARVSYLTHDGTRDIDKDLELYSRLVTANPPHWSPLEHVATPAWGSSLGNFDGWRQLRHIVSGEYRA